MPWIVATTAGFGFLVILVWPLLAAEIFGRIPGPAEPIIVTIGGGSMVAGVAAWISGKALFAALSEESDPGHGRESAV